MSQSLISILMPAYNCGKFVKQAIDSILNQTDTEFELLIADDCSTDNTKQIIDTYSDARIRKFHNEANLGYLQASNKLFNQCKGNLITFQDADDYASPDRLHKLRSFLEANPGIGCVGSNIIKADAEGNEFYRTHYPLTDEKIRADFLNYKIVMTGSALMMRKEVIEKTGIYNLYFDRIGSEDTYLYSQILDTFKVANLPEHLYYYRANPTSVGFTHKNPKAFIGHELIVRMHQRRQKQQADFIANADLKKADVYAAFLLAMKRIETSKTQAAFLFFKQTIQHPATALVFAREFAGKLFHKKHQIN